MKTIASFTVDHRKLKEGVYISRIDGDIATYDLRMRIPNTGDLLSNAAMHSLEHIFATLVRNSSSGEDVIYFGPMGCQTGFYLLMRSLDHEANLQLILEILKEIQQYTGPMPGNSEIECGNYRNLDLGLAKQEAERYYSKIKNWTTEKMRYAK
ncbi:S-ribosylhomocysteine lyase [Ructibacterium gallinarum]|uniref:S-ribosylhomocysteine lyase n=1 Tax=Ructibacterium gallinarum TaxID=2779355 RepID=A0A9D5M288_9FIRM|nr:S-ribosylhomocysteine lyase [Ructibacterium gallinarum]MBE5039275.1 S-ribosylhomocysteine lyase [Ructibacterium gallinarum]